MPKPNKKPINWVAVRAEYEAGGITHQQLADRLGVSRKTVERQSAKDNWKLAILENARKVSEQMSEQLSEKLRERIVEKKVKKVLTDLEIIDSIIQSSIEAATASAFKTSEDAIANIDKMMRLKLEFSDERIHEYCLKKGYVLTPIAELETEISDRQEETKT